MKSTSTKAIIFDMDGTLFETNVVALEGFKATFMRLQEQGYFNGPMPPDQQFLDQLGKTFDEIWSVLLPDGDQYVHDLALQWMTEIEIELIRAGKGTLYPHVTDVLHEAKNRGYQLFVASNGVEPYIAAIVDYFELNDVFVDLYSAGRFKTESKVDLVRLLLDTYGIRTGYMVGDRLSDVQAGKANGLKVVGCQFGFADNSELLGADYRIQSLQGLLPLI